MKKIIAVFAALCLAAAVFAQSAEQILAKMEEAMTAHENEGIAMTVEAKIPIVGTMSTRAYTLGNKTKVIATVHGVDVVSWDDYDSNTSWTYNSKSNKVQITSSATAAKAGEDSGDMEMFTGIAAGYDVSIKKETDSYWYILAKKSITNKDKDAPKTMEIVVRKRNYYPAALSAKVYTFTMTMKDISFGVKESDVTFNPADYPDATIEDKR